MKKKRDHRVVATERSDTMCTAMDGMDRESNVY